MERRRRLIVEDDEEINKRIQKDKLIKCWKKRQVKNCKECCRHDECAGLKKADFGDKEVDKLIGAIVFCALQDLFIKIPNPKNRKGKSQIQRRQYLLYHKASAEQFFKSHFFKLMNLDFEYLKRTYEKYYEEEKIQKD